MLRECVHFALLGVVRCAAAGERGIDVWFKDAAGNILEREEYSIYWAIFRVSGRLKADMKRHSKGGGARQEGAEQPRVEVECDPKIFYATARLLERNILDIDVGADDTVEILRFSGHLALADGHEKVALYRNLAKATMNDGSFRENVERLKDTPDIKVYMLQLLREYAGFHCVEVRVRANKATLHHAREHAYSSYGSAEKIGVIDEVKIQSGAMRSIASQNALHTLAWFIGSMHICSLHLFLCELDFYAMECIGDMRGLTRLELDSCKIATGSLKCIRLLDELRELSISGHALSGDELSAIGSMRNITVLSMNHCRTEEGGIENLWALSTLRELEFSCCDLSGNDLAAIGKMERLTKLDIHSCRVEPGFLKHVEGLKNLKILNIYGTRYFDKKQGLYSCFRMPVHVKMLGSSGFALAALCKEDKSVANGLLSRKVYVRC